MAVYAKREISKLNFKANAIAVMKEVEETGEEIVITSHGKPALIMKKFTHQNLSSLEKLRGSVVKYSSPTAPVSEEDWDLS